jgi:hypothetical protein
VRTTDGPKRDFGSGLGETLRVLFKVYLWDVAIYKQFDEGQGVRELTLNRWLSITCEASAIC